MLDKPELPDETLLTCLQAAFNPAITQVEFLPLGADNNTAVYRARELDGGSFFVRLRSGGFDPFSLSLLNYLKDQGVEPVIAPLLARDGRLWTDLDPYTVMLYPYIEGQNIYETSLPDPLWPAFGQALQRLHSISLPTEMAMRIREEQFEDSYRLSLRASLDQAGQAAHPDPIAARCAALLRQRTAEIRDLIAGTERLASNLRVQDLKFVLCHADLHAGNLLVEDNGTLHIIDWDEILLAPRERDLMYIGGGLLGNWRAPEDEEILFYQGYGPVTIDPVAMAYYRYERIITDLAIYADDLLSLRGSQEEREQSFLYMVSNFFPGGVLEIARRADRA